MAEVLDKNGDLVAWCSDDPDDFYSWSDYERLIQTLVTEYNEAAGALGENLLDYDETNPLESVNQLYSLDVEDVHDESLKSKLKEIQEWAFCRIHSNHPDEEDE